MPPLEQLAGLGESLFLLLLAHHKGCDPGTAMEETPGPGEARSTTLGPSARSPTGKLSKPLHSGAVGVRGGPNCKRD